MKNPSKVTYSKADELKSLAEGLISKHHQHLDEVKMAYLFKDKPMNKGGKPVIATAEKCNGKTKFLSGYDFIITAHEETWGLLNKKQKTAVMDHELTHCKIETDEEGEVTCKIIPHSLDEFVEIYEKYGAYSQDLEAMLAAIEKSKSKK